MSAWFKTAVALLLLTAAPAFAQDLPELEFEKYTLENGLEVVLHVDRTTPTAAVNVWYHVGSKNEKPGRTGFAHLFEHMMFQGSENHDSDYFLPLQKIGAQVNGSTNKDRTNYWENVPSDQLELALFLEADRMGNLLPAMTQEKLDNQRDVVKNEKRQGENRPYAKSREMLLEMMFPPGHPYRWTVIGSMDDLSAASISDVSDFFRLYYAPNNASLVVAGDFDPSTLKPLIEDLFGTLPRGDEPPRQTIPAIELDRVARRVVTDSVRLPMLAFAWHSPAFYAPGDANMDLLAAVLGEEPSGRLYRALVETGLAASVAVYQASAVLGSTFNIQVLAAPAADLDEIESIVDAEIAKLVADGPTEAELSAHRARYGGGDGRATTQPTGNRDLAGDGYGHGGEHC